MRKLGLVGGMGPESTIPYYHDIVYGVQEKTGAFPPLIMESVNVFEVLEMCKNEQYQALTEYLLKAVRHLAAGGADFAALSANTPHIVFDKLKAGSPIPLISIIEATCLEAERLQLTRLGLLGTVFTMTGDFFKKPFTEHGIRLITPTAEEMAFINDKISGELEMGIVKEDTRAAFLKILQRMQKEEHIEAVILGCTELPLILNSGITPVPCLDTMEIHIRTLIGEILQEA